MISFNSYFLISLIISTASVINAYAIHEQFYSTIMYLSTSKVHRLILLNAAFAFFLSLILGLVSFVFREVRESEKLSVLEKVKRKVFDFALVLIVFREDSLDLTFFVFFIGLISFSVLHWLAIKRSEYLIDESHGSFGQHFKLLMFFLGLILLDAVFLYYFYLYQRDPNARLIMSLYAFEFFLLFTKALLPFIKYIINLLEIVTFSHFESKLTIFSVLDFVFTSTKLIIQLLLLNFIRTNLGMPLHLIADTIETVFGLINTLKNFINSCYLTYRLHRLEDIDEKALKNQDSTCLICLQDIKLGKRISCGHVFHLSCLKFFIKFSPLIPFNRSWIHGNINQFCPKCKAPIKIETQKFIEEEIKDENNENNENPNEKKEEEIKMNENASNVNFDSQAPKKEHQEIIKILKEIELLESITSYDNILKKKDNFRQENNHFMYDDIIDLEKKIKENVFNFEVKNNIPMDYSKIGSFAYGLPREAVQFRTWELEGLRKRIHLLNLLWTHSIKNQNIIHKTEKYNNHNISNIINQEEEKKMEINDGPINFDIDFIQKPNNIIKPKKNEENLIENHEENVIIPRFIKEEDEKEDRRKKTLEAMEKRLSLKEE